MSKKVRDKKLGIPVLGLIFGIGMVNSVNNAFADGILALNNANSFATLINNGPNKRHIRGILQPSGKKIDLNNNGLIKTQRNGKKTFVSGLENQINLNALNFAYPGQSSQIRTTTATANSEPINGMVSATGSSADLNQSVIGGNFLRYHYDPDLSSYRFNLSLFLPHVFNADQPFGIETMTVALIDGTKFGNAVKYWQWDSEALKTGDQTFQFDFKQGVGAGGSTSSMMQREFSLAHVQYIQLSYSGLLTDSYPLTPDGNIALWDGTRQFDSSVPEPSPALPLLLGLCGLALIRHRATRRRTPILSAHEHPDL